MMDSILKKGLFFQTRPRYRKKSSNSSELSVAGNRRKTGSPAESSAMFMPSLAPSRSVRERIQEVKVVQICGSAMKSCETRGKELLDSGAITLADLNEFLKAKNVNEGTIISVGLTCYALLKTLLDSIKAGSDGFVLVDGFEITHLNRPNDKLFDWFFHPLMVVKEQLRVIKLDEDEEKFLQKVVLYGNNSPRMEAWENGSCVPQQPLRAAQIQGISRRMIGMARSVSILPTHRRRFRQVVKTLITYSTDNKEGSTLSTVKSSSIRSVACIDDHVV